MATVTEHRRKYEPDFIESLKHFCRDSPFSYVVTIQNRRTNIVTKPIVPTKNGYKIQRNISNNDLVVRKIKGILNKLTFKNFDKLSKDLYNIEITNSDLASDVMKVVYDKVLFEPSFGELYSTLCNALSHKNYCEDVNFKRELLILCQKEFYKSDILLDDRNAFKRKINNIRFIAELYKKNVIHEVIIMQCLSQYFERIDKLLCSKEPKLVLTQFQQNDIECTCKLLVMTGPKIYSKYCQEIKNFVLNLDTLSKKIPSRFKFMIFDVLDLQKNKWKPKKK